MTASTAALSRWGIHVPDVVYIVRKGDRNDELRYSLRSLRNLPHGNVWIVGYQPEWVTGTHHLATIQAGTKRENGHQNLVTASQCGDITEDFILMNDDFFVMHPIVRIPTLHRGTVDETITEFTRKRRGNGSYVASMIQTRNVLQGLGYTKPLSYELHVPIVINRERFLEAVHIVAGLGGTALNKRTVYGNVHNIGGDRIRDPKIATNWQQWKATHPFLSTSDHTFHTDRVGGHIRATFPDPSPYEKT